MAKNRIKQREHLNCSMTKEERLKKEVAQKEADLSRKEQERREELIDRRDFCGIRQPTPYEAVKRIVKKQRQYSKAMTARLFWYPEVFIPTEAGLVVLRVDYEDG